MKASDHEAITLQPDRLRSIRTLPGPHVVIESRLSQPLSLARYRQRLLPREDPHTLQFSGQYGVDLYPSKYCGFNLQSSCVNVAF